MTDDDSNHVDNDLDQFEDEFFQREPEADEAEDTNEDESEDEEVDETELETDEDTDAEDEDEESDSEDDDKEVEEKAPKPKGRKSAQERIDELTAEKYELRREIDALRRDFEAGKTPREEANPEPKALELPADAPQPDAVDKDGKPLYQLGEFDPKFIRDLTKFTIAQETKAAREEASKQETQRQVEAAQAEIQQKWTENLKEAEKAEPDIRDNIKNLGEVFKDIEPSYGEFLALSIMNSEYGPQVMNYLALNIGEAQKIVASGPEAAMRLIGRLEARFDKPIEKQPKKVSKATTPPEQRTRGHGGRFTVTPDTDDLDAFEKAFFKKR